MTCWCPLRLYSAGQVLVTFSSFCNPFSTIIASNAAGINWTDGLYERLAMFVVTTIITIWYIVRYAQKVKKDPTASLVYQIDGLVKSPYDEFEHTGEDHSVLGAKNALLLFPVFSNHRHNDTTGLSPIGRCRRLPRYSLLSAILIAFITRMKESVFIDRFVEGAKTLLIGSYDDRCCKGHNHYYERCGHITGTILYYSAGLVSKMPMVLFIVVLLIMFMLFTLVIASSSGMAVLTMPIFGSLAVIVGVPGREIVNAYLFGMGIMGLVTPVGMMLPSLGLVNISIKTWWRFIWPLMVMVTVVCAVFLIVGTRI